MKLYILSFFVLFISVCSCKKTVLTVNDQDKDLFNPVLKKEILKMVEIKTKKNKEGYHFKVCNVIISRSINNEGICIVIISLGTHVVQKTIKFVSPSDSLKIQKNLNMEVFGYTFLENELIACCLLSDSCRSNLVNINELIPYNDSISDYSEIVKDDFDMTSEFPTCVYKIVGDSLELIKSEWTSFNTQLSP
jgi:hypothetical protein